MNAAVNQATPSGVVGDMERIVRGSTVFKPEGCEAAFLQVPNGYQVKDLEFLAKQPRRIRESISHENVDSFIEYLNQWGNEDTTIFANGSDRYLRAVIDYHVDTSTPSWCSHQTSYTARLSRELLAWQSKNGQALTQVDFAEFIEDRISDVVDPVGADLLERVLKLQIIQKATFRSAIRLQTGQVQLQYSEEDENGTLELPDKITLGLPVFHNGDPYKVQARLRFKLAEGKVSFSYKLLEIDRAIEHAFAEVVAKVKAGAADVTIFAAQRAKVE